MTTAAVCPPVWQASDAALIAELAAVETRLHSTWAQMLTVVAEIDSRDMTGLGYKTTAELIRAVARIPLGEARDRIAAAADVLPAADSPARQSSPNSRPPRRQWPNTRRHLSFRDRDGGYELAGWLDREATEILRAALSPLSAPRPATDTEIDLRTAAQRDADALVDLAQRALGSGDSTHRRWATPPGAGHREPDRAARPDRDRDTGAGRTDQR